MMKYAMNQRFANITRMKTDYLMSFPTINRTGKSYTGVRTGKYRTIGYGHGAIRTGDASLLSREL